jgi:hypothetical protein
MPPKYRKSEEKASAHDQNESSITVGSTAEVATAATSRRTTRNNSRDAAVGEASATETSGKKRGNKRKRADSDEEVKQEKEEVDPVAAEPDTKKRKVRRNGGRGDNITAVKGEGEDDWEAKEEEEEPKPRPKRRTRTAQRPTTYNPPPGSKYRLSWHEYFLDLPEYVSYDQWIGWQAVLNQIPSGNRDAIVGEHAATDDRLPPGKQLRNIPTLPEYIPRESPIIVPQAFLYANTGTNWSDIISRMGHTWSTVREMYRINNKYSTAAGRWRNLIGVPSREPKLRLGQTGTTASGSVNFSGVLWNAYTMLPPHVDGAGQMNPPPPPATPVAQPTMDARASSRRLEVGAGLSNPGAAHLAGPSGRRRRQNMAERASEEVASAIPYDAPGSPAIAAATRARRGLRGTGGQGRTSSAASRDAGLTEAEDAEAAALNSRLALLSEQEIVTRVAADAAGREREATLAQIIERGFQVDPNIEQYNSVLEVAQTAPATLDPAALAYGHRLGSPSDSYLLPDVGQISTDPQPVDEFPFLDSLPEIPASWPSALWDPSRMSQEMQERIDSLVRRPPVPGTLELEPDNPLSYSEEGWKDMLEFVRMEGGYSDMLYRQDDDVEDELRYNRAIRRTPAQIAVQAQLQRQAMNFLRRSLGERRSGEGVATAGVGRKVDFNEFDRLLDEYGRKRVRQKAATQGDLISEESSGYEDEEDDDDEDESEDESEDDDDEEDDDSD